MPLWNPHYKTLDHWRGVAALWVMLFHGFGTTYDDQLHPVVEVVKAIALPGWLGVHLFFVISGYCIAASIYRLKNSDPWIFLHNRFWRLFPTYWFAFLVAIFLNLISSPFNQTRWADAVPISWQSWIGNLFLIQPYLNAPYYVTVYWSLVVEIGFYLITALLLAARNKLGLKIALAGASTLAAMAIFAPSISQQFSPVAFWGEFLCGGLVFCALLFKSQQQFAWRNLSLALLLALFMLGLWTEWASHTNQLWFSASFAGLLYLLYPLDKTIASAQMLRWLSFTGLMSYSLYLLHVPLQGRLINLGSRFIAVESPLLLLLQVLGWTVAIGGSYIFYRLCEKPLNNWRRNLKIAAS